MSYFGYFNDYIHFFKINCTNFVNRMRINRYPNHIKRQDLRHFV